MKAATLALSAAALMTAFPAVGQQRIVEWSDSSVVDPNDDLLSMGYAVPIPVDTPLPFDGFRSYSGLHMRHQDLASSTGLVHPEVVGMTRAARTIWSYRLGDFDLLTRTGLPEPAMLTQGGIHAREWQSPEVVTGIMELLTENAGDGGYYDYLLDNVNIVVTPVLNVDGFLQTQRYPSENWLGTDPGDAGFSPRDGRMRRKNMLDVDELLTTQGDHLFGVDLNRNNPPYWASSGSSSSLPESIVYHGASAHSEPETQAMLASAALGPASQLRLYTDVHSFSQANFWTRNDNDRLANLTQQLLTNFSNHHSAFPANRPYLFRSASQVARNVGIGTTEEYFLNTAQVPSWTLEIEPRHPGTWGQAVPTSGADYGGVSENGHDGFILPESQIRRVREQLAQTMSSMYYQQAGPPSIAAMRFVDSETQAVVFEAEWDVVTEEHRSLYSFQAQPLQMDREYTFWVAYDKPMRWRADGVVTAFPGQPGSTLAISGGSFVNGNPLTTILTGQRWNDQPGDAPNGYFAYRDDAFASEVSFPRNVNNLALIAGPTQLTVQQGSTDMVNQQNDADPSTVARWSGGAWAGYENASGVPGDSGGIDSTISLQATSEDLGAPFVVEPGTSAAWYDPARNGEGFMLEILEENVAVAYWFTYDVAGDQDWYIMVGEVRGNRILFDEVFQVSGGEFGPGFDPDNITETVVGSATFIWKDCAEGAMDWQVNGERGRMNLVRITHVMGIPCGQPVLAPEIPEGRLSGSWFDPSHTGEGYVLELLHNRFALVYWFTFDPEANRRWFFGVGEVVNGDLVFPDMLTTRGPSFGANYDPELFEELPWGSLTLDIGCDGGPAVYNASEEGFGSGQLEVIRLTTLTGLVCDDG